MKKPHTLTRTAASILMIPVLYIAVTGLLYGILAISLSEPVLDWMTQANLDLLPDLIYVILVCMAPVLPIVVLGSSAVGIILQIRGIRKGEDKKKGLFIIGAFVLLTVLLIVSCLALMLYLESTGGWAS
ncbi:MAG: hypothetical protein J6B24_09455 [Clostridia bacterium]|nr:hypothetical protein [Clostridia bacterium]